MLVFVGCNYEKVPFVGYRDAFRDVQSAEPRVQFRFADVRITNKVIMDKVREEILHCDVGLYDVTFRNPNVMMELGIAVGAVKPWNILYNPRADSQSWLSKGWFNKKISELPANLRGYEYLQYSSKQQLATVLASWASQTLEHASQSTADHWGKTAEEMLSLLMREPSLRIGEIANHLGGQQVAAVRLTLSELKKKGMIESQGRAAGTRYSLSSKGRRRLSARQTTSPRPLGALRPGEERP